MRAVFAGVFSIAVGLSALSWGQSDTTPPSDAADEFTTVILPILEDHCFDCHGEDIQKGGLRLDSRASMLRGGGSGEPALVPGDADGSYLVKLISGADPKRAMPYGDDPLPAEQIERIRKWIAAGAIWPGQEDSSVTLTSDHWSLQPVTSPPLPGGSDAWIHNPIDAFILARLRESGLSPSEPADRVTLIRRMYLDMLGLPPSPEEVSAFVNDSHRDAVDRLIERVLSSPHYGERWARHWLDVVRFAESDGFETNHIREHAWYYRDYVIDALNTDKPYDQFIREQLVGDLLGADAATGFLVGGTYDIVKSPDINLTQMQRQDELADMVNTTATTFLGLTVGCARCHNHKFDPILQRDFYALQAVFAGVRHGERPLESADDQKRQDQLRSIEDQIAEIERALSDQTTAAHCNPILFLDDRASGSAADLSRSDSNFRVEHLVTPRGEGENPAGTSPGFRDDFGNGSRLPNISFGHYTWWDNQPGRDFIAYRPHVAGSFRLWVSWGCGFDTHTTQARYVLDRDGDLTTTDDQELLATVNQQLAADQQQSTAAISASISSQPLWSGLFDVGTVELQPESAVLVRGGDVGSAITADLLVLQPSRTQPRLATVPAVRVPVNSRFNIDRFAPIQAKFVRFFIERSSGAEPCIDELEVFRAKSADNEKRVNIAAASAEAVATASGVYQDGAQPIHQLSHINDGRYGNDYSWIAKADTNAWVQIEFSKVETIDEIRWSRDRTARFSDRLPVAYRIEVAEEPGHWTTVADSTDRIPFGAAFVSLPALAATAGDDADSASLASEIQALAALRTERDALAAGGPSVYAGTFEQPAPIHRLYRGEPSSPREEVAPDALSVIGSLNLNSQTPEAQRRRALADWIASPDNPLTARVMVNRIWHYHFGTGIVSTPSDFGANGSPPSHPELLDWLAGEFVRGGWSIKHLHRLILSSRTYQQSNLPRADAASVDAQARLLWRFPPRRLEAEAVRDSILAVSGELNPEAGGPGFLLFDIQKETVWHYFPIDTFNSSQLRRMVYMTKLRQEQDDVFGSLDCPDGNQTIPRRNQSTTPLQALNLLNSPFMIQRSEAMAARLQKEFGEDEGRKIDRAFLLCFGRQPRADERADTREMIERFGWPAVCRALLNTNEFLFIP